MKIRIRTELSDPDCRSRVRYAQAKQDEQGETAYTKPVHAIEGIKSMI
jgi:hypothetical protein